MYCYTSLCRRWTPAHGSYIIRVEILRSSRWRTVVCSTVTSCSLSLRPSDGHVPRKARESRAGHSVQFDANGLVHRLDSRLPDHSFLACRYTIWRRMIVVPGNYSRRGAVASFGFSHRGRALSLCAMRSTSVHDVSTTQLSRLINDIVISDRHADTS
jgi:hypothetical protein